MIRSKKNILTWKTLFILLLFKHLFWNHYLLFIRDIQNTLKYLFADSVNGYHQWKTEIHSLKRGLMFSKYHTVTSLLFICSGVLYGYNNPFSPGQQALAPHCAVESRRGDDGDRRHARAAQLSAGGRQRPQRRSVAARTQDSRSCLVLPRKMTRSIRANHLVPLITISNFFYWSTAASCSFGRNRRFLPSKVTNIFIFL